jgi:hypothetical protein
MASSSATAPNSRYNVPLMLQTQLYQQLRSLHLSLRQRQALPSLRLQCRLHLLPQPRPPPGKSARARRHRRPQGISLRHPHQRLPRPSPSPPPGKQNLSPPSGPEGWGCPARAARRQCSSRHKICLSVSDGLPAVAVYTQLSNL